MEEVTGRELYEHKVSTRKTWEEVAQSYGLTVGAARKRAQKYYSKNDLPPPSEAVVGGSLEQEPEIDKGELWGRAVRVSERVKRNEERRKDRQISFARGPVVLFFMADLHLGSAGVDYGAIDEDIRVIRSVAETGVGVGVVLGGDLIDNFIVGKLQNLRKRESPFLSVEEWSLVDYALERLAPFIIGSVAGNHDNWSWAVAGVDLLRQRHMELTPGIIYDPYELNFALDVGAFSCRVVVRHAWKGHSKYNPSHGIEDGHWTRGRQFDVAVGAHTHRGGLAREIDIGGQVGYALICGTYKKVDEYGKRLGLPPTLPTAAVAIVVDDDGIQFATTNLYALPRLF